ncbi:ferric reductase-like transmembrane domain-containing protein [Tepidiforma sp.]|uniref:ferredoxin reductase family protein n=1 Tax=Tepidiforma sp. TaxID=2682230 RepID=UPI002ADDE335|nr:ferric reductase-like transmembrane domain-containing protein [Tepidiforma sp.]
MTRVMRSGRTWLAACAVIIAAMPWIAAIDHDHRGRSFLLETSIALGFMGLAMMWLQFALTARFRWIAPGTGLDTLMQLHRQAGISAFGLIAAHPVLAIAARPGFVDFFDPRASLARALALWLVSLALIAILTSSLWRRRFGIPYEWWRLAHAVLAVLIAAIGLVHVLRVGFYTDAAWKQALWTVCTAAAVGLVLHTRVVRPWLSSRRPYRVVSVTREPGTSWTLELEPVGHPGLRFQAGQFAWLTLGDRPWSLQQHPFSFASSAERPGRIAFTVKELGDWTAGIGKVQPGTRAFLDGPYGAFTVDPAARTIVGIAGGVGITPLMSILRTARDRGDTRQFALLYAAGSLDSMVYREELETLRNQLPLDLMLLPREAPPGWDGPSGLPTAETIDALVDRYGTGGTAYLICGPPPLMDLAERRLLARGVPARAIRAERFDIA